MTVFLARPIKSIGREFITCKLLTITCSTSVNCRSRATGSKPTTGALHPEHCTSFNLVPATATSSISKLLRLQGGQFAMMLLRLLGQSLSTRQKRAPAAQFGEPVQCRLDTGGRQRTIRLSAGAMWASLAVAKDHALCHSPLTAVHGHRDRSAERQGHRHSLNIGMAGEGLRFVWCEAIYLDCRITQTSRWRQSV
jgi:hypothetical protein